MKRNPLYFCKSKHQVYQFRYSFPIAIYRDFDVQREIKLSLRTKNRQLTLQRYFHVYRQTIIFIDKLNELIIKNKATMTSSTLETVINEHKRKIQLDDLKDINLDQRFEISALQGKLKLKTTS